MIHPNRHIDFTDLPEADEQHPVHGPDEPLLAPGGETLNRPGPGTDENESEKARFRVRELIDGTILVRENIVKQLPFVLFLTVLGILYIGNRFHAESMVRQISKLKTEVSNLRTEQITTTSELMNISRPSQVEALVRSKNLGLKESLEPPRKLKRR